MTSGQSITFTYWVKNIDGIAGFVINNIVNTTPNATGATVISTLPTATVNSTTYSQVTVNFTAPGAGNYYLGIQNNTATSSPNYLFFDDFSVSALLCSTPGSNAAVSAVTTTGATLTWTAGSPAPATYDYIVVAAGTGIAGTQLASGNTASLTAPVSGLTAQTSYDVYVRGNCGANKSSYVGPTNFTTACAPQAIPTPPGNYSEGVESVTTPNLPACITQQPIAAVTWVSGTSYPHTGTKDIQMALNANGDDVLWLPPFSFVAGKTYQISVWVKAGFSPGGGTTNSLIFYVGSAANYTTATAVATYSPTVSTTYTQYTATYNETSSTTRYVGIRSALADPTTNYAVLDDIIVTEVLCASPGTPTFSSLAPTSATLNWTAASPVPSSGYDWKVVATGAGSGGAAVAGGNTASLTVSATGLTANTSYDVYVRGNCGAAQSSYVGPVTFTTPCNPLTIPWADGFEGVTGVTSSTAGATPPCWSLTTFAGPEWYAHTTGQTFQSVRTGSYAASTKYTFSTADETLWTPGLTLTGGQVYVFSFWMKNYNTVAGFVETIYGNSSASLTGATQMGQIVNPVNTAFQQFQYYFSPATTGTYYFGTRSQIATSAPEYLSFDDFSVNVGPSCLPPNTVTINSVNPTAINFSNTAPVFGTPASYNYEIRTAGAAGSGATGLAASGTYTGFSASNSTLTPNTSYTLYVQSNCGGSGLSTWTAGNAFTTPCNPVALPLTEDFESLASTGSGILPACWTSIAVSGTIFKSDVSGGSGYPNSGTKYLWETYSANNAVALPPVSLIAGQIYQLQFSGRNQDGVAGTVIKLKYNTVPSLTGAKKIRADFDGTTTPNTNTGSYQVFSGQLIAPTTGTYYFIVQDSVPLAPNGFSFDDFSIKQVLCGGPPTPTVGTVTNNSAVLNWSNIPTATDGYEYQISNDNGVTWSATSTLAAGSTTTTATSLAGCTSYQFRIRSICNSNSQQSPYSVASFTTTGPSAAPYSQGFEGLATTSGTLPACWSFETVSGAHYYAPTSSYKRTGSNGFYTYATTAGVSWVYGPALQLTGGVTYRLRFYAANYSGQNTLEVGYGTAAASGSMTNIVDVTSGLPSGYVNPTGKVDYLITPATSGTYYFGLRNTHTGTFYYVITDDFSFKVAPTCVEPAAVSVTATGPSSVSATIGAAATPPANGYFYHLSTGTGSYTAPAFLGQEALTAGTSVSLAGLVDGSQYTIWVRSYCGPGTAPTDSSEWVSNTFTFSVPIAYSVAKTNTPFTTIIGNPSALPFAWSYSSTNTDDNYSDVITLPFTFTYNGITKNKLRVSTNGWMQVYGVGNATPGTAIGTNLTNYNYSADTNLIAPMWDDLTLGGATTGTLSTLQGNIQYLVTGTAPNRVCTIEWKNVNRYTGSAFGYMQFQVRIEETTNNIAIHYGQMQLFDFVVAGNVLNTATIGLTGKLLNGTPTAGQAIVMQPGNQTNRWSHNGFLSTSDAGANKIQVLPACNDRYQFTPGTLGALTAPDTTAPSNDDVSLPITLPSLGTKPTNLCAYRFSTKFATPTVGIPTLLADNATNGYADDDVWFTFQALSASTSIEMVGSGGMLPAFQVYDAAYNPVAGGVKVATTYGSSIKLILSSLNTGDFYNIRAYHANTGVRATATATVSGGVVTGITLNTPGSGYNYGGIFGPEVNIIGGGGTGAIADAVGGSGTVTSLTLRDGGSGYTSAPTVYINRPDFSVTGEFGIYVFSTPVPPANDLVKNAVTLTAASSTCTGVTNQLTYAATGSGASPVCSGTIDDDVWYQVVATSPVTSIRVTPNAAPNSMNVALQIFNAGATGDTTTMTSLGCFDSFSGIGAAGQEAVDVNSVIGNTYYIRVYTTASGDGGLTGKFSICTFSPPTLKYAFTQSNGTYTPITGGTTVTNGDDASTLINLSTPFSYNGYSITHVTMNTNGWLSFGNLSTTTNYTPLSSLQLDSGLVSAFGADLNSSTVAGAAPSMSWNLVGGIYTFQWKDVGQYSYTSGQKFSFQIKLNTANSQISMVYDSTTVATSINTGATPQVGLRAGSVFVPYYVSNRTNTNLWTNSTTGATAAAGFTNVQSGQFPKGGLTFTYSVNAIAGYPIYTGLVGATNYPSKNSARVRWMPKVEATSGYYIRWRKRTDPITVATYATPTAVGTGVSDTSFTITGLTTSTAYIYDVAARQGANVSNYGPAGSFTTSPADFDLVLLDVTGPTPNSSLCSGSTTTITARVKNNGVQSLPIGTTVGISIVVTKPDATTTTLTGSTTLSAALAPGAATPVTTTGTLTFALTGAYSLQSSSVLATDENTTNDTKTALDTLNSSSVASTPYFNGFNVAAGQDFLFKSSVGSTNWSITNTLASPAFTPREGANFLVFNSTTTGNSANAFSPCFNIVNTCSFLRFKITQNGSGFATNYGEGVYVYVSTDNGVTYNSTPLSLQNLRTRASGLVASRYNGQGAGTNYFTEYEGDLSSFNGQTIKLKLQAVSQGGYAFAIDSFAIGQRPANDVTIVSFASPEPAPSCASANTPVQVVLRNLGCNAQTNVPFNLVITGPAGFTPVNVTDTVYGTILSSQSVTQTVRTVDMTIAGTYTFTATSSLAGDADATNNGFGPYTVVINASNLPPVATATLTPSAILVGASATFSGTAPAGGPITYANNTNYSIPVIPGTGQFSSVINIPLTGTIAAALTSVQVNMTHTYDSDVRMSLFSPSGDSINLVSNRGGSGDDFVNTTFSPTASTAISAGTAPFSGVFIPENPFSTLTGSINGNWRLHVVDAVNGDGGALSNWSITLNNGPVVTTWTANAGNPAATPGFPYAGTSPGSKTFNTAGVYNYTFTSAYTNGCATVIQKSLLVSNGNVWLGGSGGNDWNVGANWQFGAFTPGSSAVIPQASGTANPPMTSTNINVANLDIATGVTITTGAGTTFSIAGNVTGGNLSQVQGAGTINLSGTVPQTINGIVRLARLTVSNSNATNGLTFAPGAELNIMPLGTLTLSANTKVNVPAGTKLRLMSDATGTARLAPVPASATFVGNITMMRKTPNTPGWYFVAAPVSGSTLNEWSEAQIRITPKNNTNVFEYTENDTTRSTYFNHLTEVAGWKIPSTLTNVINPAGKPKGYRLYLNSTFMTNQSQLLSSDGPPVIGNAAFPFTFTPAGGFGGGGWNLVGNPYPSEIDWQAVKTDAAAGNAAQPITDQMQIWNPVLSAYGNYSIGLGIGTNGASRYIASSQSFFIRSSGAGTLNFRESHKSSQASNTFVRDAFPTNTIRMTLANATHSDQSIVGFRSFGLNGRDMFDADKLDGSFVNISTKPESNMDLVGNVMGELVGQTTIPVRALSMVQGDHTLSFEGTDGFDAGITIYLRDNYTNTMTDIVATTSYAFTITNDPASQGVNRFELVFSPANVTVVKGAAKAGLSVWPNPAEKTDHLNVRLSNLGNGSAVLSLTDALGRSVLRKEAALTQGSVETTLPIQALPAGVYILRAKSGTASIVKEIVIK